MLISGYLFAENISTASCTQIPLPIKKAHHRRAKTKNIHCEGRHITKIIKECSVASL